MLDADAKLSDYANRHRIAVEGVFIDYGAGDEPRTDLENLIKFVARNRVDYILVEDFRQFTDRPLEMARWFDALADRGIRPLRPDFCPAPAIGADGLSSPLKNRRIVRKP